MSTISELQQQINEAENKVYQLREKLASELKAERIQALQTAKKIVKTHSFTAAELGMTSKKADASASTDKRATVAPKYKDPKSQNTWTGRGKTPAWLAAHLAAGQSKQDFLI